jgi:hypothetical protein
MVSRVLRSIAVLAVFVAMIAFTASASTQTEEPRTPGYWKNHSDPLGRHYDVTWDQVGGSDQEFAGTGQSWLGVLQRPTNGNAYYILAHQYIAAQLNILAGTLNSVEAESSTDGSDIELIVDHAWSLLQTNQPDSDLLDSTHGSASLEIVRAAMRQDFINTAFVLDEFNNSGEEHEDD